MTARKPITTRDDAIKEAELAKRALDQAVRRVEDAKAALEALATLAEPEDRAVIRFVRHLPAFGHGRDATNAYSYAAIRSGSRWFTTGSTCPARGFSWHELIEFIREGRSAISVEVLTHESTLDLR